MKKYLPQFFLRGLCAMGFGPIVLAIIYGSLGAAGIAASLTPTEVCLGILSIALMAFIAGGVTMVYQIESLPLLSAILLHGGALYLDYLIMYLLKEFEEKNGSTICSVIKGVETKKVLRSCDGCVEDATAIVEKYMEGKL